MRVGEKIKLQTNVGKLKKGEVVTVTGIDQALRMAFLNNGNGIYESVDRDFSNYTRVNDSNDMLSDKELLKLAKQVNWNEDKMLNELRKLNLDVSNSDLQAIVEGFLLLNKPTTKDSLDKYIIERYKLEDNSKIFIVKVPSGKFYNVYGEYKGASNAGPFDTLDEARKMLKKHRSTAIKDDKEFKYPKGSLKVGQTFTSGKEKGKILKLEWHPKYGYDVLYYKESSNQNVWTGAESNFIADSNETLKSYRIKNHNTGKTYQVKATSYQDAKEKYEKYIKDGNSFTYKGYVIIKSSYGWKVKIGNKIIEFATDKEAKEYIDLHKDSITEDADFYGASQGSEKADDILFALQVMYGEPKYTYSDFQKMNLSQSKINEALVYVKKKGYNKFSYFDSFNDSSDDIYILTKNNYQAVNYEQALKYGERRGLEQVFRVNKKEFNSLVKTAKEARVNNPNEWAFNRLHRERKTKTFDSFSEDANCDTLLANLGFAHNQGTGDIQIWKYRDKDRDKFEKAIEHIRRVDRKLILSASSQSSGEHKITIMKPTNDSFSEDATLAQLEIKNLFLEEDENADDVIYIGNNEERKISFYSYGDKYFAFFDLENRVEVITKDEVQRILKKNIIEASEKESDELFGEGDLGIAATVRAEDYESITLSQFSPDKLIKAVIDNKQSMKIYVKAPDGNTYVIAVYSDFVSVVRIEPDGKQKRVVDKSFTRFYFEEALVILKGIKKQLGQGGYR